MATFFSGLKRLQATRFQSGVPKECGKDPLPYSLCQELCTSTLGRQDDGFSHFVLVTQWNLMCRSESVQTLCTEHLSAHDDSVGCVMHKSKTYQEGNRPKNPRHMYANPLNPATCWITALAMYLACRPLQKPGPLFTGSQQKSRFGTALRQLIGERTGINHYGTHSIQKSVATFGCSGTTGGPSIASVCLRVGWSLGGVRDRYIRYESARDQYLGRVVAGLPLNRAEFSILPPHFSDNQDPILIDTITKMSPALKAASSIQDILKLCIASLVYHESYPREALPPSHPLFLVSIFRHGHVLIKLRSRAAPPASLWMKPTGIPPHVVLYKQLVTMHTSIDNLPPVLLEGISSLIEKKGVAAGNITKDQLETTIERLLEHAGFVQGQDPVPQQLHQPAGTRGVHFDGGKFHLLPQSFLFPRTGAFGAWQLWWFGDEHQGFPPLRYVGPQDLPSRSMQKSLSDWSALIRHIADAAISTGLTIPVNMSEQEAAEVFRVGIKHVTLAPSTRKRRLAELSATTVLRLIRESRVRGQ